MPDTTRRPQDAAESMTMLMSTVLLLLWGPALADSWWDGFWNYNQQQSPDNQKLREVLAEQQNQIKSLTQQVEMQALTVRLLAEKLGLNDDHAIEPRKLQAISDRTASLKLNPSGGPESDISASTTGTLSLTAANNIELAAVRVTTGNLSVGAQGTTPDSPEGGEVQLAASPTGGAPWITDVYQDSFRIHTNGSVKLRMYANGTANVAELSSDALVVGDTMRTLNGNVGLGTATPAEKLSVNGHVQVMNGNMLKLLTAAGNQRGYMSAQESSPHLTVSTSGNEDICFQDGTHCNLFIEGTNGNVGLGTATPAEKLHVGGNIRVDGTVSIPASSSPSLGAYASSSTSMTSGVVHTTIFSGGSPPSPAGNFQILNVRENGHWGGFGALLTVFDHYYTPGRREYWYSSRAGSTISAVTSLGSTDCSLSVTSNGRIYDPSGTTNDLYEYQIFLAVPNYHYCSVRIEFTAGSTTWMPDSTGTQSSSERSVKLTTNVANW